MRRAGAERAGPGGPRRGGQVRRGPDPGAPGKEGRGREGQTQGPQVRRGGLALPVRGRKAAVSKRDKALLLLF